MNWLAFVISTWIVLGLEMGLGPVLSPRGGAVSPSFVIPLLVFVGLHAPSRHCHWAAIVLGVMLDLLNPMLRVDGGELTIVGPHALGCLIAMQVVLSIRGMVIRQPLTMIILSAVAALIAGIVAAAIMTVRSFYPADANPIAWDTAHELLAVGGSGLYTALSALFLALLLFGLLPFFGFHHAAPARTIKRQAY